jgi:hypothetical protein
MRDKINKVEFAHLHLLDLHYKWTEYSQINRPPQHSENDRCLWDEHSYIDSLRTFERRKPLRLFEKVWFSWKKRCQNNGLPPFMCCLSTWIEHCASWYKTLKYSFQISRLNWISIFRYIYSQIES